MDYKKINEILSDMLDNIDEKILLLIKQEAYCTKELSKKIGLSGTGTHYRLVNLEKKKKLVSVKIGLKKYYCDPSQVEKKDKPKGVVFSEYKPKVEKKKSKASRKNKRWTKTEDEELMNILKVYGKNKLPKGVSADLSRRLNRPITAIWSRICDMRKGLKKPEKLVTEKGNARVEGSYDYTAY